MALYDIFIGTYSKGEGRGLFRGSFDSAGGEITLGVSLDIENPSYLQLSNNILYGVSELAEFEGENGGALFSVDLGAGENSPGAVGPMKLIDIRATHGKHPCHLCIKDDSIFVSNYSEGSLSIFKRGPSGQIEPSIMSLYHFGKSIREDRQKSAHIHFAAMTPDEKFLALCDLGMDKVFLYPYSAGKGLSTGALKVDCPPGSGPRHLSFSSCGNYMYVLTELGNTILSYEYNGGEPRFLKEYSTLPELNSPPGLGFPTPGANSSPGAAASTAASTSMPSTSAAIHLSPDGSYLASSNRGHDSIALFKVGEGGSLSLADHLKTGKCPRDFRFSPCGKWLLSANQNDDSVTIFRREKDGFSQTASVELPKPVCILFGEAINPGN